MGRVWCAMTWIETLCWDNTRHAWNHEGKNACLGMLTWFSIDLEQSLR
jgi:hypothetical protein